MIKRRICFLVLLSIFFLFGETAFGQSGSSSKSSVDPLIDSLFAVRTFKEVAISPDGSRVAWVESLQGKNHAPSPDTAIYVSDLKSPSRPRLVTAGNGKTHHAEHNIAWSKDGSRLAFLSDVEKKGQLEVYVAAASGGPVRKLTNLTGFLADPRWSPDGKLLAVLFTENAPRAAGPLEPGTAATGLIEEQIYEQRIAIIDTDSGSVRQISPADLYVYEYDWSPDGKSFAAIAAHGSGDNNWFIAQLYTISISSGEMKSIFKPTLQIAIPRWSPDGKSIAFISGLMSDEGSTGGDIFIVSATGGEPRNITPGMQASASWLTWLPSSNHILFTEHIDGSSGIATVDPKDGAITELWSGAESISAERGSFNISLSMDEKTCALIRQSFQSPPEVWAGSIGALEQITHANQNIHPGWGEAKNLHWTSDGMNIQGWLLFPRNYDSSKRYPMVVAVHGGPASSRKPSWPGVSFDPILLSSEDYFVFFPNPRGSFGRGEKFTQANVKDFGHGDLRDILAGVDEVVKTFPVDDNRVGVTGWSYGGFMTMWAVTQTDRFRAAVAGAGIANWQSYYGQNGIDQWMIPYFGASVYDDPAVYAKSSPINFIKKVKTPTLILVGDRDLECPVPQSYEFWHALKTLGVKTQFVVYPNEGHRISKPDHRRDIIRRLVSWFNDHLMGEEKTTKAQRSERKY